MSTCNYSEKKAMLLSVVTMLLCASSWISGVSARIGMNRPSGNSPLLPFRSKVAFVMPMLGNLAGELEFSSPESWYVRTTPAIMAKALLYGPFEEPSSNKSLDGDDEYDTEDTYSRIVEGFRSASGNIHEDDSVYLALKGTKFDAWTDKGALSMESEEDLGLFYPFILCAPGLQETFQQWEKLTPTSDSINMGYEKLIGWSGPEWNSEGHQSPSQYEGYVVRWSRRSWSSIFPSHRF